MTRDQLTKRLIDLAGIRFERDTSELAAADDFFEKLGIDSFQAMELMTDLEEEFDIEIPDYELQGVNTFEKLAVVIEARI